MLKDNIKFTNHPDLPVHSFLGDTYLENYHQEHKALAHFEKALQYDAHTTNPIQNPFESYS